MSAQSTDPGPLSAEDRRRLTWEDATERMLDAAAIDAGEWPHPLARLKDSLTWPLINVAVGAHARCVTAQCAASRATECRCISNQAHRLTLPELLSQTWPHDANAIIAL